MKRTRAWRRYKNYTKAKRKRKLDKDVYGGSPYWHPWYDNLHEYDKGKIFCSCPMCASKSSNKGAKYCWYAPAWNPTINDLRKAIAMDEDEFENKIRYKKNRHNRRKKY